MIGFLVKFKVPVALVFFGCQFIWYWSGANFLEWNSITLPAMMSFLFLAGFWLLLVVDMMNSRFYNKTFWLISMLILPNIAPAIYLFQRKKLHHLSSSVFSKK